MRSEMVEVAARAWLADDPDPVTSAELTGLLHRGDTAVLTEAFGACLQFGTAGIRGPLGPGPNRMNVSVVRRLAAAVAPWAAPGPVVVGYDGRARSSDFAAELAGVLGGAGVRASILPGPCPTPLVAFTVRELSATAGLMVTASHNPRQDNGVKVFDGTGAQVVAPDDQTISDAMEHVGAVRDLPHGPFVQLGADLMAVYLDAAAERVPTGPREVKVVHTALHGVGTEPLRSLFQRAGFAPPLSVAVQAQPDPMFPTLSTPNPEDPSAFDLAIALAAQEGADLVVATDPDADRLGVAIPTAMGWRRLTGDEIGALLAEQALSTTAGDGRVVASSVVSSTLLGRLAAEHGARWVRTLTGFKWIARAVDDSPSERLVFAYEEALGYAVHDLVRDKDALTAAAAIAAMTAACKADGTDLGARLEHIAGRHGLHATAQWAIPAAGLDGARRIKTAVERLSATPPKALADRRVTEIERPARDVVILWLARGARVVARPSGTEPKLKVYGQVVIDDPTDWPSADTQLAELGAAITAELAL